jgi:hypothetical protein
MLNGLGIKVRCTAFLPYGQSVLGVASGSQNVFSVNRYLTQFFCSKLPLLEVGQMSTCGPAWQKSDIGMRLLIVDIKGQISKRIDISAYVGIVNQSRCVCW